LRHNPTPDVEVIRNLGTGRIADGKLRSLDQPGLDRIRQREVAHHPRQWTVGILADAAYEIRRRREIDAEVDPTQLVDTIQPLDPDGRLFVELVDSES
jgi:hypothetical protein